MLLESLSYILGRLYMNKLFAFVLTAVMTFFIVFLPPSNKAWLYKWEKILPEETQDSTGSNHTGKVVQPNLEQESPNPKNSIQVTSSGKSFPSFSMQAEIQKGIAYVKLDDIVKKLPIQANVDKKNGEIKLQYDQNTYELLRDVSVLNKDGLFVPMKDAPIFDENNDAWIPVSLFQQEWKQQINVSGQSVQWEFDPSLIPSTKPQKLSSMSKEEMSQYLSFLNTPIKGAHVTKRASSLPGAPRTYRNGVHEGIDWYSSDTGISITKKTPVISMADGIVVRADHGYKEMTTQQRNRLLSVGVKNDKQTPAYILDKLRGRSVWIQYDNGVLARYVHLDRISDEIKVGQTIRTGELIGYVGNSGTSDGALGNNNGLHLHLDLFIYGKWFWEDYSMDERLYILEQVFNRK